VDEASFRGVAGDVKIRSFEVAPLTQAIRVPAHSLHQSVPWNIALLDSFDRAYRKYILICGDYGAYIGGIYGASSLAGVQ
jgi:hypothetical protein